MKQVISEKPFNGQITNKLAAMFKNKEFPLALAEAERIYINFVNDTVRKAQKSISTQIPEISSYNGGKIYQATAFFARDEETKLERYLPEGCEFARWCDHGVDIISQKGGKVEGIKYFCEHYGIKQNEIMAFGDAENDIDMIKFAEIGIAMGNAQDCVKAAADHITTDIDDNGIKNAIEFFKVLP